MTKPKITVVMPVYNGEKYIKEAIDSVLKQTFTDFELLIINDGSTDRSVEIVKSCTDTRIRLIENEKNYGLAVTRNRGLKESDTEYIAMLDCDDLAYPRRLEKQIDFLDANPEFGMVGTWVELIDESGKLTGVKWEERLSPEKIPVMLLFQNYFAQSSITLRKKALPNEHYRLEFPPSEDFDLWIRIAENWKTWNLPEILTKYRTHDSSTAKNKSEKQHQAVDKILTLQLNKIGINPTPDELKIHRTNYAYFGDDIKNFINIRKKWIQKIIEANKKTGYYKEPEFSEVINEIWFNTCYSNTKSGFFIWKEFWRSPLSQNQNHPIKILKFFVKCLIKK